jgi:hypothetical protein
MLSLPQSVDVLLIPFKFALRDYGWSLWMVLE